MPFSVDALCARMREVPESFLPPLNEKLVPIMNAFVADTIMHISGQLPEANAVHLFDFRTKISKLNADRNFDFEYFFFEFNCCSF